MRRRHRSFFAHFLQSRRTETELLRNHNEVARLDPYYPQLPPPQRVPVMGKVRRRGKTSRAGRWYVHSLPILSVKCRDCDITLHIYVCKERGEGHQEKRWQYIVQAALLRGHILSARPAQEAWNKKVLVLSSQDF